VVAAHGNSLRVLIMVLGLTDALSAAKALQERIAIERRREADEQQQDRGRDLDPPRQIRGAGEHREQDQKDLKIAFHLVLRFRSSHRLAAPLFANFGIKGALANLLILVRL
jgi:hypothetical protein